jgi:hypothetical protein
MKRQLVFTTLSLYLLDEGDVIALQKDASYNSLSNVISWLSDGKPRTKLSPRFCVFDVNFNSVVNDEVHELIKALPEWISASGRTRKKL